MKRFIFISVLVAVLGACSSEEEYEVYSCDEGLNEWAHTNLRTLHAMDRAEWLKLGEDYKRAAFAAFTPTQKLLFWKAKIQEVLTMDWSDQERTHIQKLYDYLEENTDMYEKDVLNDSIKDDAFRQFVAHWEVDAICELEWSEEQVRGVLYTGNKMVNKQGDVETIYEVRLRTSGEGGSSKYCDCHNSEARCNNGCESAAEMGCGAFGAKPCNGKF